MSHLAKENVEAHTAKQVARYVLGLRNVTNGKVSIYLKGSLLNLNEWINEFTTKNLGQCQVHNNHARKQLCYYL